MIGFDLLNNKVNKNDADWIYQNIGKLYYRWIKHWSDGTASSYDDECHANIIYI